HRLYRRPQLPRLGRRRWQEVELSLVFVRGPWPPGALRTRCARRRHLREQQNLPVVEQRLLIRPREIRRRLLGRPLFVLYMKLGHRLQPKRVCPRRRRRRRDRGQRVARLAAAAPTSVLGFIVSSSTISAR